MGNRRGIEGVWGRKGQGVKVRGLGVWVGV